MSTEFKASGETGTNQPVVSIVTPSYNQGVFIEKTIRSVIFQDYPKVEYIVVDALSNDGTADILHKYRHRIAKVICEKDEGQADAIDKGFRASSGVIMAYINTDDCYANPQVVRTAVKLFEKHPDVDVIYGRREFIDENGFFKLNFPFREFDREVLFESCYLPQECTFWRRSIYEKAGNCVDKSFRFAMDYDLWLRLLTAGAKFLSVDKWFGLFRYYPGQKSQDIWQKHGLPEIAKLHEKYLDRVVSENEMILKYEEYYYGINRGVDLQTFQVAIPFWDSYISYKKKLLNQVPRDQWVFHSLAGSEGFSLEPKPSKV